MKKRKQQQHKLNCFRKRNGRREQRDEKRRHTSDYPMILLRSGRECPFTASEGNQRKAKDEEVLEVNRVQGTTTKKA